MPKKEMSKSDKYLGKAYCPFCGAPIKVYEHSTQATCSHMWGSLSKYSGVLSAMRALRRK